MVGSGVALSRSDVGGVPNSALTSGTVLFVPSARATDVATMAGVEPGSAAELAHASFALDEAATSALGAIAVAIGGDGRFPVTVADGRYLVCLADIFVDHVAGSPYSVVGCAEVALPTDPASGLSVSFGEGGVEALLG